MVPEPHQEVVFGSLRRGVRAVLVAWNRLAWDTDACRFGGGCHFCGSLTVSAVDVVLVHPPKEMKNSFT